MNEPITHGQLFWTQVMSFTWWVMEASRPDQSTSEEHQNTAASAEYKALHDWVHENITLQTLRHYRQNHQGFSFQIVFSYFPSKTCLYSDYWNKTFNGIVYPKMKMLSLFTQLLKTCVNLFQNSWRHPLTNIWIWDCYIKKYMEVNGYR